MLKYKLGIFDDIKCDHQFYNPVKYYRNDIDLILEREDRYIFCSMYYGLNEKLGLV